MADTNPLGGEAPQPASPDKKIAVVAVHGMGEQRPMTTLWGLVDALWSHDPDIQPRANVYSKPEDLVGNFELRRITTSYATMEDGEKKRADFFEFYWAHLMTGNTLNSVISWALGLFLRRPAIVPPNLRFPWIVGLLAIAVIAACALILAAKQAGVDLPLPSWIYLAVAAAAAVAGIVATRWIAPVAGDAARYLSPTPDNVAARQAIRQAGLDLLTKLHDSKRYDRIIVIGHSLGSVVAYDVLSVFFAKKQGALETAHRRNAAVMNALAELETVSGALRHAPAQDAPAARAAFRQSQRIYQELLRTESDPAWLVTDFVTLGSPLSKAEVLLAADRKELEIRKARREYPSSPPWFEVDRPDSRRFRFSYPLDQAIRKPHHAAVFAPVIWTNIYFPSRAILFGDIISGPCAPQLGRGIRDIRLKIGAPVFRHLDYWKHPQKTPAPEWIQALRKAVNLRLRPETDLWRA